MLAGEEVFFRFTAANGKTKALVSQQARDLVCAPSFWAWAGFDFSRGFMGPKGDSHMIAVLLREELWQEVISTTALLARLPDDRLDWRPHAKSDSLGGLASHLINILTWLPNTMDTAELDLYAVKEDWTTPQTTTAADAQGRLEANARAAIESISPLPDEAFFETWTLRAGQYELFRGSKYEVIRRFVINHMVHHRGQLCVYLRLLGVPLPQIYGPTADDKR